MSNTYTIINAATAQGATARAIKGIAMAIALGAITSGIGRPAMAQRLSQRDMLRRLAQSTGNDAASVALKMGRDFLDDQQWLKAEQKFNEYVTMYASDKNLDQGLYWLAYSQLKLDQYPQCQKTLTQLFARYPNSTWSRDGRTLWVQIPGAPALMPTDNETDDFKIAVLQALFQVDVARGIAAATDFLKQGSTASVRLKGAALSLLAHNGGKQVTPIILNVATNEPDLKLRTRAISALAATHDDSVIDPLRNFVLTSQDSEIVEAALYAIGQHPSPQAIVVLGEIAMSNRPNSLRKVAIASIANRPGEPAVDQLLKIYDAESSVEIRKSVISGFANRRSERAAAKLLEIARGADNIELRKAAINGIARRGGERAIDTLLSIYDAEKNDELKDQIIGSLAYSNDKRVTQKLIEIARNPQVSIERRKRAIGWLSRSKDPDVLKFLEDLLK
jgi:HEAT repeat protein